mmetsp:Transcript_35389/g.92576  ORF Transcript_35389/g.92576 Transcript_35389/m.92576 type:complete len:349 (+) Transcript_35389:56-1102(+)
MQAALRIMRAGARAGHLFVTSPGKSKTKVVAAGVLAAGGVGVVATLGEPFGTEVEQVAIAAGAEYRLKGLAPRKNNNYTEEPVVLQYVYRARDRVRRFFEDYIEESQVTVLLPPMLDGRFRANGGRNDYTLVVDFEKTLVFTEFKVTRGHRTIKRPGVDYFLDWAAANCAEVVLFADADRLDLESLVVKLDRKFPDGVFSHLLFKGDMRTVDGKLVKDVSLLNRDPAKVIMLDDLAENLAAHPENLLEVAPFEGDPDDTVLIDLIPFLNSLISSNKDVRETLPAWQGLGNPGLAFSNKLAIQYDQQRRAQAAAATATVPAAPNTGMSPASAQPAAASGGYSLFGVRII